MCRSVSVSISSSSGMRGSAVSANAKRLWDAVVVLVALAILAVSLRYGGMPLMMVATIAVVVFQARRSWKE